MDLNKNIEEKYLTTLQTKIKLADPQNLYVVVGRGAGKTTEALAARFVRVTYSMKRSVVALGGPTYILVLDTIVAGILSHLNKYYIRGVQFEYNKRPPKHFDVPFDEITDWNHTISMAWGTVAKFIAIDRPETSGIGKNMAHVFADEGLRMKETNFVERLVPTMRGDRTIHGHSPFFGGISLFSSYPNLENDHDWFMSQRDNYDKKLIEEIQDIQLEIDHKYIQFHQTKSKAEKARILRYIMNWSLKVNEKRKGSTYFVEGSSFTNLAVLGLDYMERQYLASKNNLAKFKLSVLGIRDAVARNPFFSQFSEKNIFEDSYIYKHIDTFNLDGERKQSSSDLKYCQPNMPLIMGLDPGDFMSCVFAQQKNVGHDKELRIFKNFWVISPDEHFEMAQKINEYFGPHQNKTIYLHYDRAGNQKKEKYRNNPKGTTDATILKKFLNDLGWTVHLMSLDQRTIYFWEHFLLQSRLFGEKEAKVPKVKICQYECEQLISSIRMSPRKKSDNVFIELDKSTEKNLDKESQVYYSPQIATAMMYLLFGLFEKWMPSGKPESYDIEGL